MQKMKVAYRYLFDSAYGAANHFLARWLFLRALGLIYFSAFFALLFQIRGLIGAQVFNVQLPTRSGLQIAEFSPAGLNLDRVKQACDLTPKKPSKD